MEHRKMTHKEQCKDALINKCRFSQISCFLNHGDAESPNPATIRRHNSDPGQHNDPLMAKIFTQEKDFPRDNLNPLPPGKVTQDQTKMILQQILALLQTLL